MTLWRWRVEIAADTAYMEEDPSIPTGVGAAGSRAAGCCPPGCAPGLPLGSSPARPPPPLLVSINVLGGGRGRGSTVVGRKLLLAPGLEVGVPG
jgi:hypothetical protein